MSVVTKNTNSNTLKAFVKGSPEKIEELCKTETLPEGYN